jgi:P4 family phage/plasmid primase-like protien
MSNLENKQLLKDAIAALSIPTLWARLGINGTPKLGDNRSPLRDDDRTASFSIFDEGRRAKDHGTGWVGDSYDFYQEYTKKNSKDAFVPFVTLAGLSHRLNGNGNGNGSTAVVQFDWEKCVRNTTEDHLRELSAWRGFDIKFCQELTEGKVIGRFENFWAFPVTDGEEIIGCHYLLDQDNKKWRFNPKGTKAWPLILGDLSNCVEVHLLESTWDGLALYEHMPSDVVVVITRGAQHGAKVRSVEIPKNAKVLVWPQNDKPKADGTIPSEQWFEGVKKEIHGEFLRIQTPLKYADLNDWTRDGAKFKELRKAVDDAEKVAGSGQGNGHAPRADHAPALNESERVALLEPKLPPLLVWEKEWYIFKEGFWQITDRDVYRPDALETMPECERTARKAKETLDHLEGLRQLPSDPFRDASRFDGDDILLNIADGVLRVRPNGTANIETASKEHYFCSRIPCSYNEFSEAPLFEAALIQALPDVKDRELFLLWCASILVPDSRFEAALCCYGPGGTGKSTLAGGIQGALGKNVTRFLTMKEICSEQGYHVPQLRRAMLNISTELDAVAIENSEHFKRLISGEEVMARSIYGKPFVMSTYCKFLFLTNHLPRFKSGTDAELRRLRFLRFEVAIKNVDTSLKSRILEEREGIFNLLIQSLMTLLKLKTIPYGGANSTQTLARFAVTNDPVGSFVQNECVVDPKDFTAKAVLGNRFSEYLDKIGLPSTIGDNFFKILYDRYPTVMQKRLSTEGRPRVIAGIGLRP